MTSSSSQVISMLNNRQTVQTISLQTKLISALAIIILMTFCVSGYISYRLHQDISEQEISEQFSETVSQIMTSIDLRVQGVYGNTNQIVFNPFILDIIQESNHHSTISYFKHRSIEQVLNQYMLDDPQLLSIHIFDMDGNQFKTSNDLLNQELSEDMYIKLSRYMQDTEGELVWLRPSVHELFEYTELDQEVIIAARWMKDSRLETYGLLVLVLHERFFCK